MSVKLVKIPSPLNLDINVKVDLDYVSGKTLDLYLAGQIPNTPGMEWVACINGLPVGPEYWRVTAVADGDKIAVCPKQGYGVAAGVAAWAAAAAGGTATYIGVTGAVLTAWGAVVYGATFLATMFVMGFGASMLASALGTSSNGSSSSASETTYGWDALHQTFTEGEDIPLIFGEVKTSGQAINQFIRTTAVTGSLSQQESSTETMFLLNALCDHELDEITDFEISGQPASYYSDCTITTRLGTLNDELIPGFGELVTQTDVDSIASYGNPVVAQTQGDCEKIEVVMSAPEGLFRIRNSKGLYNHTVDYKVEYRVVGDTTWIIAESGTWRGESQTAIKKVISIDGLSLGQYEVQLTRMEEDETRYQNRNKISIECLQEIVKEKLIYPGLAKYGVQVVANDQLSNGVPAVTCIAKRLTVQVYDEDQGLWVSKSAKNPAWVCYGILIYHNIPTSRIIWQDFVDWADYCDTDIGDGEKRHEIGVLVSGGTAWDQLQKIAQMGDAAIIRRNTKYGVFVDIPTDSVDHLFTMGNIVEDTFNIQYLPKKDRASAVEIEYNDVDRDHTRQVVTVMSDDYITSDRNREKATVSFEAAMTQAEAVRHGVRTINSNKYLIRVVTFDAWIDAFACVVGDVFEFQHEAINYLKSDIGGIVSGAGNDDGSGNPYVTLDRPVKLEEGYVYKLKVRYGDDTTSEKTVDNTQIADFDIEHSTLPLTQAWATIPTNNDVYAFGRADTYLKKYRITDASRKNEHMRQIIGLEYVDEIYTENDGYVIEEPDWDPQYDTAVNVSANEILLPSKAGVYTSQLNVTWHRAFSTARNTWGIWLEDTTAETKPKKVGSATGQQFTIESGLILDHTYTIYVCADLLGLVNTGSNTATVTILGKEAPPDDIATFSGSWDSITRTVTFSWSAIDDADLDRYEVQEGGTWTDDETAILVVKNGDTGGYIFIEEGVSETRAYCIKAVDTSGNYSENETATAVAIDTSECALVVPGDLTLTSTSVIANDGANVVIMLAVWNGDAELSDYWHHYDVMLEVMDSGKKSMYSTTEQDFSWQLIPNKEYGVSVRAVDVSGNKTDWCTQEAHTTAKDETAPATPTWPETGAAIPGFKVVGLSWNDNTEGDFSHYLLERSIVSDFSSDITELGEIKASFASDSNGLDVSTTYYYRLKAVDTSGNESGYSDIVSATTTQVGATDIAYNSLIASHIQTLDLDALTAKIVGTLAAGVLQSNNWGTDDGMQIDLDNGLLRIGGSSDPKLSFDGVNLALQDIVLTLASGSSGYTNLSDSPIAQIGLTNGTVYTDIDGDTVTALSTHPGGWIADVYSTASFTGSAKVSFKPLTTGYYFMVGLTQDPTTDSSYTSIDYAFYCRNDGSLYIHESGVNKGSVGTYTTSTVLDIIYTGAAVVYTVNGTAVYSSAASSGLTFYIDSSFYDAGASFQLLSFSSGTDLASIINSGVTTIDGPIITTGSLTAEAVGTNEIISHTSNLGDAVVTTLKIGDQAVTIPVSSTTTGTTTLTSTSYVDVKSITITSTGAPIEITASFLHYGVDGVVNRVGVQIRRGGTTLRDTSVLCWGALPDYFTMKFSETPGSGTYTYYIYCNNSYPSYGNVYVNYKHISLLETKK